MPDELSELVDSPSEQLHVEYKSWLDLEQPKSRADLARHIAAIANFGGGFIVFGIDDNDESCGPAPAGFSLDHDLVASVTKKYLEPAVHCDVRRTRSMRGVEHLVVVVPPHGAVPVCAKANGPENKGKVEGIVAGAYYLRKPGPESAQIVTAAEWRDVIRRCALHDRSAILAAVTAALSTGRDAAQHAGPETILERWAKAADAEYLVRLGDREYPVPVRDCRIQFSYMVETEESEELPAERFMDLIRQVASEVDRHVATGWSLFYVFGAEPLAPRWASDPASPAEEFVQASFVEGDHTLGFDLWRISRTGLATTIREYWEDTPEFKLGTRVAVNPRQLIKTLGELVWHADAFCGRFSAPVRVHFRCEWRGLKGRRLFVPDAIPFRTRPAATDHVVTTGTWAAGVLRSETADVVYKLAGKLARALDWDELKPSLIAAEMPNWKRL